MFLTNIVPITARGLSAAISTAGIALAGKYGLALSRTALDAETSPDTDDFSLEPREVGARQQEEGKWNCFQRTTRLIDYLLLRPKQ